MSTNDYLGEFETLVLLSILQLGDDAYGIEILRVLNEDAGRDVSFGAVYSSLRRMKKKGFVESRLGDPSPVRGGRAKKFFTVTEKGLDVVRTSLASLNRLTANLEPILDPAGEWSR